MRVEISPAAAVDLDEIWFYGAEQWSFKQANRYQNNLLDMAQFLAEHPELGKDRSEIKSGYKSYTVGSHILFFWENDDILRVIRVLHKRMDYMRHLVN